MDATYKVEIYNADGKHLGGYDEVTQFETDGPWLKLHAGDGARHLLHTSPGDRVEIRPEG